MRKKGLLKIILGVSLVTVLTVGLPLMGCAPTAAPEAPAPEAPAPAPEAPAPEAPAPVVEPDAYEEYVASLSMGELPVPREAFEQAIEEGKLYIWDWAEWWPEEVFEGFSEEFGIEVIRDHFSNMAEVRTKFSLYPETPYDLVIGMGTQDLVMLQEAGAIGQINHDWMPNVFEYMAEEFMDLENDPGLKYSVVMDVSFNAYLYNKELVDDPRIPSWAVLFEPLDEYKGRITLWDNMHETIGAVLKHLGYHWFTDDEAELMEARDLLMELKPDVMAYDSWPSSLLYGDEAVISALWYGDGWFLNDEYEAILPALPAEGSLLALDLTLLPIGSPNPAAAHLFENYLFRPQVMALYIESVRYVPSHSEVLELLSEKALAAVTLPEGYLDKCDLFDTRGVTGRGLELRTEIWEEVRR